MPQEGIGVGPQANSAYVAQMRDRYVPPSPARPPANTALLSPAAFARLMQPPPTDVAPASAVADSPRPSLLRQGTAAMARHAQAAPTQAPQQKSWKVALGVLIGVGVLVAVLFHDIDYALENS